MSTVVEPPVTDTSGRPPGLPARAARWAAAGVGGATAAVVGLFGLFALAYLISWTVVAVLVALGVGA